MAKLAFPCPAKVKKPQTPPSSLPPVAFPISTPHGPSCAAKSSQVSAPFWSPKCNYAGSDPKEYLEMIAAEGPHRFLGCFSLRYGLAGALMFITVRALGWIFDEIPLSLDYTYPNACFD
jgi:hypothetical protein